MAARTATNSATKKRAQAPHTRTTDVARQVRAEEEVSSSFTLLLAVFAVSVLLFIAILGLGGVFGSACRMVVFGIFGIFGYLFPIAFLAATFFAVSNRGSGFATAKLICGILTYLLLSILVEVFLHGKDTLGAIGAFYAGRQSHSGGGLIGGLFSDILVHMFGVIGTYVVCFAGLVICLVVLTEDSKPVLHYRSNKDIRQRKAVLRQRERQHRRMREEEQRRMHETSRRRAAQTRREKFSGISLDTTIHPTDPAVVRQQAEAAAQQQLEAAIGSVEQPKSDAIEVPLDTADMAPQVSKEQTSKEQIKDKTEQAVTHIAWKPQTRSIEPQYTEGVPDHMAVSNPMIDRMSTQEELLNEVPTIENPVEKAVEGSAEEPVSFKPSDNLQEISLSALEERQKVEEEVKTFAAQPGEIYRPMSDPDEPLGSYLAYDTIRDVSGSDSFEIENEPAVAAVEPVSENIPALIKAVDDHFAASGIVDEGAVDLGEDVKTGEEPSVEQTGTADMASVVELPEPEMAPESDMFWGDIPEIMPEVERETLLTQEPTSEEAGIQGVSPFEQEVEKETTTIEEVTTERPVAMQEAVVVADTATEKMMPKDSIAVEEAETEESLIIEQPPIPEYHLPPIDLLSVPSQKSGTSEQELRETSEKLHQTLANFGVNVTITDAVCGPTVTRYELQPEKGVKVSKIVNLADDIKLNLAAADIRIEAPIPGKPAIGIEVPNREATVVSFRELMESPDFEKAKSPITFAAGRDIGGKIMISDIAKMPHVLIAGATGSGKSVCINTIIMSILYKAMPDEVKFIMIDPKVVELSVYNGIPHLLIPVVTDPKKAAGALQWAVKEMMDRYDKFAKTGVRDMKGYNAKILNGQICYEMHGKTMEVAAEKMPQIVVIVDELADLMMVASHEVEESICRLAQLARAAGIHLVIATQRPSVNVITGLIKANMPSRIAFAVTSGVDSRTILDMVGAEKLLGKGDMLYYPQGLPKPLRVQGAFVSDKEVAKVVDFIRNQVGPVEYDANIDSEMSSIEETSQSASSAPQERQDDRDAYFDEAVRILTGRKKASISMLQRYLKVGFNRAARIIDQLEEAGIVGPDEGTMGRKVLITPQEKEEPGEKAPEAEEEANE